MSIRNFIQKFVSSVQASDDNAKKRWIAACTIITMLMVISLWSVYFKNSVQTLNLPDTPIIQEASVLSTFSVGSKILAQKITHAISAGIAHIKSLSQETRSVTLQTATLNFVLEGLPTVSPKSLPR